MKMKDTEFDSKINSLFKSFELSNKDKYCMNTNLIELENLQHSQVQQYELFIKSLKTYYQTKLNKIMENNTRYLKNKEYTENILHTLKSLLDNDTCFNGQKTVIDQIEDIVTLIQKKFKEHEYKERQYNEINNTLNELQMENKNLRKKIDHSESLSNNVQKNLKLSLDNNILNIENKYKFDLSKLTCENKCLKKQIMEKNVLIENQKNLWTEESKQLDNILNNIDKDKQNLALQTKSLLINEKNKLFNVIKNLHDKFVAERLEKQKMVTQIKSRLNARLKSSQLEFERVEEQNETLKDEIKHMQTKLSRIVSDNTRLNSEYVEVIGNAKQDLETIAAGKNEKIKSLMQELAIVQRDSKQKTQEYNKKKQVYCKIIIKLRNQLKKQNSIEEDNAAKYNNGLLAQSYDEAQHSPIKHLIPKPIKLKKIPIGKDVFHKLCDS